MVALSLSSSSSLLPTGAYSHVKACAGMSPSCVSYSPVSYASSQLAEASTQQQDDFIGLLFRPSFQLFQASREYATESDQEQRRYTPFTQPSQQLPVGQDYWSRAAAAPKPTLQDFKPSRRALLELTVGDNASPLVQQPNRAIPAELHAMVEELIAGDWPPSTCNAIGIYLDALCRRERICRRELNRSGLMARNARLTRAADPWQLPNQPEGDTWLDHYTSRAPEVIEDDWPDVKKYAAEMQATWQRTLGIFDAILAREDRHIPNRYVGSFLASCGYLGDVERARVAFDYAMRAGNRAPPMFYFFLVHAHAVAKDFNGAQAAYEAFVQARWHARDEGADEEAEDEFATTGLRFNTRRYRVGTTYVGEPIQSMADTAGAMGAMMLRVAFASGHTNYADRLWEAMLRRDDLAPPIRACNVIEYFLGVVERRSSDAALAVFQRICKDEALHRTLASPYNYRAILRRLTDMREPRRPEVIARVYHQLMQDSHDFAFPHFTSELHLSIDALVAAAVEPGRPEHHSKAILQECVDLYQLSKRDEEEGRLLVETAQVERWFRLSTGVSYRLCGALALFGMHDAATSIYADMVRVALPGLRDSTAIVSPERIEAFSAAHDETDIAPPVYATPSYSPPRIASTSARPREDRSLHTVPTPALIDDMGIVPSVREADGQVKAPHAFLLLGAHALGERVVGADPSLSSILTVWRAQEALDFPKATRFMQTRARFRAAAATDEVDLLTDEERASLKRLWTAWSVDKHYPTRLQTRCAKRLEALTAAQGEVKGDQRWRKIWIKGKHPGLPMY